MYEYRTLESFSDVHVLFLSCHSTPTLLNNYKTFPQMLTNTQAFIEELHPGSLGFGIQCQLLDENYDN